MQRFYLRPFVCWVVSALLGIGALGAGQTATRPAGGDGEPAKAARMRLDLYGDPLPIGALVRLGTTRLAMPSYVRRVLLPPGGEHMITITGAEILFWRLRDGQLARRIQFDMLPVQTAVVSPDGKLIAVGGLQVWDADKPRQLTVHIYETATGKHVRLLHVPASAILRLRLGGGRLLPPLGPPPPVWAPLALAFTPDGRRVLTSDLPARLWDVASGKIVRKFAQEHKRSVVTALSLDGKIVATSDKASVIRLWDAETGRALRALAPQPSAKTGPASAPAARPAERAPTKIAKRPRAIVELAFSPDGRLLASRDSKGGVRVWDSSGATRPRSLAPSGKALAMCFSGDGARLIVREPQAVRFWDPATGKELEDRRIPVPDGTETYVSLAVSKDGGRLAMTVGAPSLSADLWDLTRGKRIWSDRPRHRYYVDSLELSGDGRFVYTLCRSVIRKWDARTGRLLLRMRGNPELLGQGSIRLFPGDKTLVSLSHGAGGIQFWDTATGKRRGDLVPAGRARGIAVSPDGRLLATTEDSLKGRNIKIHLRRAATGRVVRTFGMPGRNVYPPLFTPDGRRLVCRSDDGLSVTDVREGGKSRTFAICRVFRLMCLPDNRTVIVDGGADITRKTIFNLASGREVDSFVGNATAIYKYRMSPDRRFLVTGGGAREYKIRVWEIISAQPVLTFQAGPGFCPAMAISRDGRRVVTVGPDAMVWSLDPWDHTTDPPPSAEDLPQLWEDLEAIDPVKAHRAAWAMIRIGAAAVELLGGKLKAVKRGRTVADLIADLDDPAFRVREKATQRLAYMDAAVQLALRTALTRSPSLEARSRLKSILDKGYSPVLPFFLRRRPRALMVLERIVGDEARDVLRRLAAGDPDHPLTGGAAEALRRLAPQADGRSGR